MTCKPCDNPPCDSPATVGPAPYYQQVAPQVIEDHQTYLQTNSYAAGIYISTDWIIPAQNSEITATVLNVTNIPVGSFLYASRYGYFKITNWNPNTGTIGLTNDGVVGTAAAGTSVPAGVLFIVTPRPCCVDNTADLFPYVLNDFLAPAVGASLAVNITSPFGLRVGDNIRIGTGLYSLTYVSSTQIVIKNNGAGLNPGYSVIAKNGLGEFQYLLVSEVASPCSADDVDVVRLIGCEGNVQKILRGSLRNQVPVLQDILADTVKYQLLDADVRVCTQLTAVFNIAPAQLTYTIAVTNTTGFNVADAIVIDFNNIRFYVSAVGINTLDLANYLNIPTGLTLSIPPGASVCKMLSADRLKQDFELGINSEVVTRSNTVAAEAAARIATDVGLQTAIDAINLAGIPNAVNGEASNRYVADVNLQTQINNKQANQTSGVSAAFTPSTLTADNTSKNGAEAYIYFNNNTTQNRVVLISGSALMRAEINTSATTRTTVRTLQETEVLTGPIGSVALGAYQLSQATERAYEFTTNGVFSCDEQQSISRSVIIAPGYEMKCRARVSCTLVTKDVANNVNVKVLTCILDAIAVSL